MKHARSFKNAHEQRATRWPETWQSPAKSTSSAPQHHINDSRHTQHNDSGDHIQAALCLKPGTKLSKQPATDFDITSGTTANGKLAGTLQQRNTPERMPRLAQGMDGRPTSAWCRGRPPRLGEPGGDSAEASGGGGAALGPCRTSWPRMARCTKRPTSGEAQYAKWLLMAPSQGPARPGRARPGGSSWSAQGCAGGRGRRRRQAPAARWARRGRPAAPAAPARRRPASRRAPGGRARPRRAARRARPRRPARPTARPRSAGSSGSGPAPAGAGRPARRRLRAAAVLSWSARGRGRCAGMTHLA